ncbi:MAG: spore maturation protein CgeB [Myxococcota bacterium]|jgi:spore maturation protein CgeB
MSGGPIRHRNYRIMRVSALRDADASQVIYRDDPGLRSRSYAEQQRAWFAQKVGHGDALARAMKSMGHEALEIVCDHEALQRTWAFERGIKVDGVNWQSEIVLEQIAEWKPDILLLQNFDVLPASHRRELRDRVPSIEIVAIHQEPVHITSGVIRELASADVLFATTPSLVHQCKEFGLPAHLVYGCFDPGVLSELPLPSRLDDQTFLDFTYFDVGEASGKFLDMDAACSTLQHDTPLEVWSNRRNHSRRPAVAHSSSFGLDYYTALQRSRLTYLPHGDVFKGSAGQRALFEATGVGACAVTNEARNLVDLFEPDTEIVTYGCVEECVEKVGYLLEHESERQAIAAAGRARTLANHSSRSRYSEINSVLQAALAGKRRTVRTRWQGFSGALGA